MYSDIFNKTEKINIVKSVTVSWLLTTQHFIESVTHLKDDKRKEKH